MKKEKLWVLFLALSAAFVLNQRIASAQTASDAPRMKKVIVEYQRDIAVFHLEKPISVPRLKKEQARNQNPEAAAIGMFSAMAEGNFDWWLSLWTKDSQILMLNRYKEQGRTPADLTKNWVGTLTDRPIEIVGKAEFVRKGENFALVRYRSLNRKLTTVDINTTKQADAVTQDFYGTMVFKRSNELRWEASQDLISDPLMADDSDLWDVKKTEIRVLRKAE
jgi:hypothetical protein